MFFLGLFIVIVASAQFGTGNGVANDDSKNISMRQLRTSRRLSEPDHPNQSEKVLLNEQQTSNSSNSEHQHQQDPKQPLIEEQIREKQTKQYLGGLYPKVDENLMPLYLKDTLSPREIDPRWKEIIDGDVPFFWHVPKANGSTMKNILNFCFNLTRAENVYGPPSMTEIRDHIINMDVNSPEGIQHAFENDLVSSGKIDVIVSNYFTSGSALFTPEHHGRAFTIMRHPIDLAESLFHYRKKASWEPSYRKDWNKITFAQYVSSDDYIGNWMVHQLTGTMPWVELTESHFEHAKTILRQKIFVGIASQMDETLRQLKQYFHWKEEQPFCAFNYLHSTPTNTNSHPKMTRGSSQWNEVASKEKWDLSLYYYALELFAQQRERFPPPDRSSEALISIKATSVDET